MPGRPLTADLDAGLSPFSMKLSRRRYGPRLRDESASTPRCHSSRAKHHPHRAVVIPSVQDSTHPLASVIHAALFGLTVAAGSGLFNWPARAADYSGTEARKKNYRIPAGPLGRTLSAFAATSGVLLSFDRATTEGKTSTGLFGDYTVQEGFAALLAGSGLLAAKEAHGGYTLKRASVLPAKMQPPRASTASEPSVDVDVVLPPVTVTGHPEQDHGYKADLSALATRLPCQSSRHRPPWAWRLKNSSRTVRRAT